MKLSIKTIHGCIFIGVLGGLLGSLFIEINSFLGRLRKKIIKSKLAKVVETGLIALLTITVIFSLCLIFDNCVKIPA